MRLLAVADLHYSLPQFDWVLEIAADFDVVVLAGDHLELASIVDRRAQSVVVRKYFSRLRALTRVVTCSGNHDLDAPNETGEKIAKWLGGGQTEGVSSDGESFVIDDTLFTICPWWGMGRSRAPASRRNSPRPRGSRASIARVTSSANQGFAILSLRCDHQCDHLAEIHVGQLLELRLRQNLLWAEEASVNRVSIQVLEHFQDCVAVIVTDGPNCDRSAILQCLAAGIVSRIHHSALNR
jgi:Icc-related predicted phosphoesterase